MRKLPYSIFKKLPASAKKAVSKAVNGTKKRSTKRKPKRRF